MLASPVVSRRGTRTTVDMPATMPDEAMLASVRRDGFASSKGSHHGSRSVTADSDLRDGGGGRLRETGVVHRLTATTLFGCPWTRLNPGDRANASGFGSRCCEPLADYTEKAEQVAAVPFHEAPRDFRGGEREAD